MHTTCKLCNRIMAVNKGWILRKHCISNESSAELCQGSKTKISQALIDSELSRIDRVKKMEEERETHWKQIKKSRYTKEWRDARKNHIGESCEICGSKEKLAIHHTDINSYSDIEKYKTMADGKIQTLCKRCHFAMHNGMELCPICKKKYKYKKYKTCFNCKTD